MQFCLHISLWGGLGDVWRFGKLERSQQQITQDINLFKVPDDLDSLVRVLLGILEGE